MFPEIKVFWRRQGDLGRPLVFQGVNLILRQFRRLTDYCHDANGLWPMTTWVATDRNPAPYRQRVGFARNDGDESGYPAQSQVAQPSSFYNLLFVGKRLH